jgi:cephalosporin-C deacetylase-like acetyl esterase
MTVSAAEYTVCDLQGFSEMKSVVELQKEVWGPADRDVVPVTLLVPSAKLGGVLIGAFHNRTLVGFVYGFLGCEKGRLLIHSEMLAKLDRRSPRQMPTLRSTVRLAAALAFGCACAMGQGSEPVGMLRSYLQKLAFQQLSSRKELVSQIRTREQFEKRKEEVRRQLLAMMGGLPEERSPLNVRKVGTIDRGDYRIEKVIFESLPNFYVTADLYVPQTGRPPYPAVLQPTGHSLAAKARAFYQNLGLGLVKNGFVVLTYDPVGQGERRIYFDPALGDSKVGGTTLEHEMAGVQSLLAGESIARYMVWDGMRSIDVLQSLSYVDPKRIGISGCSGGGTLTAYLAALDDRLQAAAPSCYITDWEDQLLGTGPQDGEQQFPDQFRNGLNHADLVEAFAPKPYLICSTTEDFFPIAGSRKAFAESQRIYSLLGAPDKISTSYDSGPHGTTQLQRQAIYAWMNRWLKGQNGEMHPEPAFQTEYEEDLLSTPTGQVSTSLGGETPSTWNMHRLSKLSPSRPVLKGPSELKSLKARLEQDIVRLTRYEASPGPLQAKVMEQTERKGYRLTHLTYETGPGRTIAALLAEPQPDQSRRKAILFVDERGKAAAAAPHGDIEELAQLGYTVLAVDPSGTGESASHWSSYSDSWFGQEKVTWLALMVGKPLVGLRMDDILRGIDLLRERNLLYGGECLGFGKGFAAVDLLHGAVMDGRIAGLVIEGGLLSYASIARTPIHRQIFDSVVPGVLGKYDLPDLVASLAPRPVWLVNMRSPLGNQVFLREARSEYEYAQAGYAAVGAAGALRLGLRREGESIGAAYPTLR